MFLAGIKHKLRQISLHQKQMFYFIRPQTKLLPLLVSCRLCVIFTCNLLGCVYRLSCMPSVISEVQRTHDVPIDPVKVGAVAYDIGRALNTELKCLIMESASAKEYLRSDQTFQNMYPFPRKIEGPRLFRGFYPSRIDGPAKQIGLPYLGVSHDDEGRLLIRRTPYGTRIKALGGHLLKLSVDSSIPTRRLVSEAIIARDDKGNVTDNPVYTRIGVLDYLLAEASNDSWQASLDIAGSLSIQPWVVKNHLDRLTKTKLVEKKTQTNGRKVAYYRLAEPNSLRDPVEVTSRYLTIIKRFAAGDPKAADEGDRYNYEIVGNERLVPILIQRSLESSPHTGKSFSHKAKQAGAA